jgi:regulatory protein
MPAAITFPQALTKARAYCARQERCQQEVRNKLYAWELATLDVEAAIAQLIGEGYLNEARFAEHFAVSKFRQKGWGLRKVEQALKAKQVSEPCIRLGMKSIAEDEYREALNKAVARRWDRVKEEDPYVRRQKVFRYFLGKGFPADGIQAALAALAT